MTLLGRGLLGAAIGAALTLLVHPVSRPFLFSAFLDPAQKPAPAQRQIPDDLVQLSSWMLAIGDRFVHRRDLTPAEVDNSIEAAQKGIKLDPQNPYWYQMLASLYHLKGRKGDAKQLWFRAATRDLWNDYQSTRLLQEREKLAEVFGSPESWQLAYLYYQRSDSAVLTISSYSRSLLATAPMKTKDGLLIRAANVQNGASIRTGSRSIHIGDFGAQMSEMACHATDLGEGANRHKLFLARLSMHKGLRDLGYPTLADEVSHIYREVDAWTALEDSQDATEQTAELGAISLLCVGLPCAFLVLAVLGFAIWALGCRFQSLEQINPIPTGIVSATFGLFVYAITQLPLAAVAAFLSCLFLVLGPKRERKLRIDDLGPMFSFTIGTLGTVFILLLGAFVVGTGAPAVSLLPYLNTPRDYFGGSAVLLGLSTIVLSILLLVAPLFAIALRIGTPYVLGVSLRKFGGFLACVSLFAIVVGTPACIYEDRQLAESLRRMVTNEPVYYLGMPR